MARLRVFQHLSRHLSRQWLSRQFLMLAILAWAIGCQAAPAPLADARDLAGDARVMREQRVPMLVLYSQDHCSWCDRARREFIAPIAKEANADARLVAREVRIDRNTPLIDFDGKATTHRAFARRHKARVTPTLMFFGPDGELVAETIVGVRLPDFYATYIDRALDDGLAKLRGTGQ